MISARQAAPRTHSTWSMKLNRLLTLALLAAFACPTVAAGPPTSVVSINCGTDAAPAASEAPNLHGNWDILMDVGGELSFGLLSIGQVDGGYGGSLTPVRTAPVVVRKITLTGNTIHMAVASREGDVLFDGTLSGKGNRMCGKVTYHDGSAFPMVAQRRPSTYQSRAPQAQ
jgi:hypothetical protein